MDMYKQAYSNLPYKAMPLSCCYSLRFCYFMPVLFFYVQGVSARRETGKKIIMDSRVSLLKKDCSAISRSVPVKLCGICFEDSADMFEGSLCLHRFCQACMTRYIHSMLEQRRHQIYCPHDSCGEALTLDECRYFLPAEIFEQWSYFTMFMEFDNKLFPLSNFIFLFYIFKNQNKTILFFIYITYYLNFVCRFYFWL